MTCSEVVELITAYLDGALDELTEMLVVCHLDGCRSCGTVLDQNRQIIRMLGSTLGSTDRPKALPPARRATLLAAFRDAHR